MYVILSLKSMFNTLLLLEDSVWSPEQNKTNYAQAFLKLRAECLSNYRL